jgi:CRP/FNR family transcriptional regulator, anaerobic regulatory protein
LRRLAVFKPNTAEEIGFIDVMKRGQIRMPAGDEIVRQGDRDPGLYSILSGWAFRFKTLTDGRRQILNFLLPGDLISFQAHLLGDSEHSVEALTEVDLCMFSRSKIWELYNRYPELAFDVTWLAAHYEGMVDENLVSSGRRTALEAIAMLLIHVYKRASAVGLVKEGGVDLPITQQHIADAMGISLVHTNKTPRRLHKLGFFRLEEAPPRACRSKGASEISRLL